MILRAWSEAQTVRAREDVRLEEEQRHELKDNSTSYGFVVRVSLR